MSVNEQEWSHYIGSDEIEVKPQKLNIEIPQENKVAVAKRLGLHNIDQLKVELSLQRNSISKAVHVQGQINAKLCQKCVVTTEPVEEIINEQFEAWFAEPNEAVSFEKARRERMSQREREDQPMLDEVDEPELIIDGKIDLGELVIQHLSLALVAYPRKDGAHYENPEKETDEVYAADNPFAKLKDWKSK